MKIKRTHILRLFFLSILLVFQSCSTKKKAWTNRQYHNITAKYNGYFNGNESLKLGVKKIEENHIDDYTQVLPVYKTRDLQKNKKTHSYMDKAIQKGSIVIQKHSIKIEGKEYCKWIDDNYFLVGKGYFYKGEYQEAIKTFLYIKNEYENSNRNIDASLWLIRSYIQTNKFNSADAEIEELEENKKLTKKNHTELTKLKAEHYLKQNQKELALKELIRLDKKIRIKNRKSRLNYIMGQIYQSNKQFKKAEEAYVNVVRSNPEYEMVFNARMNIATLGNLQKKDVLKMKKKLLRMTRDEKNKEYLDQIHHTIGKMLINSGDTLGAVEHYILSTKESIENQSQKALSFLALAEIFYSQSEYVEANSYYDSSVYYMDEDYRLYNDTKERKEILNELILNLNIVELEDSLQFLGGLSENELNKAINDIINKEKEKERKKLEKEKQQQQLIAESNRNNIRGEEFGANTSGGNWYFYNPATLSFGFSEFRKKWGKRKLEDDWRRKDKKTSFNFSTDSIAADSAKTPNIKNTQTADYYLEQIPKNKEDFLNSNIKIKEALHKTGLIYREDLQEYQKSTQAFQSIISRFKDDEEYAPLAYYNIYLNYKKQNKLSKANEVSKTILKKHPNSIYAYMINESASINNEVDKKNEDEKTYQKTYKKYLEKNYKEVLFLTEKIKNDKYQTKYILLRAISFLAESDTIKCKQELQKIVSISSETNEGKTANHLITSLKNPSQMLKANEIALTGSDYLFRANSPHISIIVLPKQGVDITYLKTLISDYHSLAFSNEVFEITSMLMGPEKHLIMIKTFNTAKETLEYNDLLIQDKNINQELNRSSFRVMPISFENFKQFYKDQDLEGYYRFFTKNYLKNN